MKLVGVMKKLLGIFLLQKCLYTENDRPLYNKNLDYYVVHVENDFEKSDLAIFTYLIVKGEIPDDWNTVK